MKVGAVGAGVFDAFTTLKITLDITSPNEAAFEVGDDGSWKELETFIALGRDYQVFVNDRPCMIGRIEVQDAPVDSSGGIAIRFTVRTKLADANYATADPRTSVKGVTLKQFLLDLYRPLGYTESDFVFSQDVARDLITGKTSGGGAPIDLEEIKEDQAKVNPPESIFAAGDRHLRRFGFMHWDGPDGSIVVGSPNDAQEPRYRFIQKRGKGGAENNVLSLNRSKDYSEVPALVGVFGVSGKKGFTKSKVRSVIADDDVSAAGFYRPILIQAEGIKSQAIAEAAARREMSARSRRKDAWDVDVDGLSFWDGRRRINYGPDTTCSIVSDVLGGATGRYYVHRVELSRTPNDGDTAVLNVLREGIWRLK